MARKHEISTNIIHTWMGKYRKPGSVGKLPRAKDDRHKAIEKQLKEVSTQNDMLKHLLAYKESELAILRELRDTQNPL